MASTKHVVKLIILANSVRPGGRCIAGINSETGKWIRPITNTENHAIPDKEFIKSIKLLDVVQILLTGKHPNPSDKYQIENEFVNNFKWKVVGKVRTSSLRKYCQNSEKIFHSSSDKVNPSILDKLPPSDWNSLQLVETKVSFEKDLFRKSQWRAIFKDGIKNKLNLKVTDPVATQQLNKGKNLNGKRLLVVSLAQPWTPKNSKKIFCYKLVAGVI